MECNGIIEGYVCVSDEWDEIIFDFNKGVIYYLGKDLDYFKPETMMNVLQEKLSEGSMVILKPQRKIKKFKL